MTTRFSPRATHGRPVRQALLATLLLVAHAAATTAAIMAVWTVMDRRMDKAVARDVARRVDALLGDRSMAEAEAWLIETANRRPRITVELVHRYEEYLPVMPKLAHRLGARPGPNGAWTISDVR